MNSQKGFIKLPILIIIIASILILGVGGYFGVKQYKNYQFQKAEKERLAYETQRQKDLEVQKLKEEVEKLKSQKPQTITKVIKETITENGSTYDLSSIIQQWSPYIAYLECTFEYLDQVTAGSGLYVPLDGGIDRWVITNKHVVAKEIGGKTFGANFCNIKLPSMESIKAPNSWIRTIKTQDVGALIFERGVTFGGNLTSEPPILCDKTPSIGDSVVILGYPSIGSSQGITATEGIISGYEGDYFITSAKIEHGNSGGVAILPKYNCYVGIPTAAVAGEIESLGLILDINKVEWFR